MKFKLKNITLAIFWASVIILLFANNLQAQSTGTTYRYLFEMVKRNQYDSIKTQLDRISLQNIEMDYTTERSYSAPSGMGIFAIFALPGAIAHALSPKTKHHQITLMEMAVASGNDEKEKVEFIEYLLKRGADPNKYYNSHAPIIIAAKSNFTETVKLLYKYGANANSGGDNAAYIAIEKNNRELFAYFIENKEVPFSDINSGTSMIASALASGDLEMMDLILGTGVKFETSPLIYKSCNKISSGKYSIYDSVYISMIDKLSNHGFKANETNSSKETPLQFAINQGCRDLAFAVLSYTQNIDNINLDGETALIMAVRNGYTSIVKKLVDVGANINIKNNKGKTARMLAMNDRYYEIADYLESNEQMLRDRNKKLAHLLINDSIDKNLKNDSALKIIRAGITFDACRIRPYISKKHYYYDGPSYFLHYAIQKNMYIIVEELLKQGADPNALDVIDKHYPLEYALPFKDTSMARLLLNYGADVQNPNLKREIFSNRYAAGESENSVNSRNLLKAEFFKTIRLTKGEQGWYYFTTQSTNLFSFYADSATTFNNDGYAYVKQKGKWSIINTNGYKMINDADSLSTVQIIDDSFFSRKHLYIRSYNEGKWILNDISEYYSPKHTYDLLGTFQFGNRSYALAKLHNEYCFIDRNEHIWERFDEISINKKGKIFGTYKGKKERLKYIGEPPMEFFR